MTRLVGDQGATLFVIDLEGGNYRQVPVGMPHGVWPATGHECWVAETGRLAYSEVCPGDVARRRGNLMAAKPGDEGGVPLAPGYLLMHISVSRCGHFFVGDAMGMAGIPLVVGSVRTGHTAILCNSMTSLGQAQYLHTHPYISSDNRRVIFNSDRSGVPQLYMAGIPDGLLDGLDSPAGVGN